MRHKAQLIMLIISGLLICGVEREAFAQAVPELGDSSLPRDVRGGFFEKDQVRKSVPTRVDAFSAANNSMVPDIEAPPRRRAATTPRVPKEPSDSFAISGAAIAEPTAPAEPKTPNLAGPSGPSAPKPPRQPRLQEDQEEPVFPQVQHELYREMSRDESFANVLRAAEALSERMDKVRQSPNQGAVRSGDFYREALDAVEGVVEESDPAARRRKQAESNRF